MTSKVFRTSVVGMIMLAGILSPSAFAIVPAHSSSSATVQTEQVAAVSYRGEATEVQQAAPKEQPRTGMTQQEKKEYAQENDSFGGGITIIAMVIVILALAILSILFGIFGKISARLLTKKKIEATGADASAGNGSAKSPDSGEVIAAISLALAEHLDGKGHDKERTILTLRRMKRAYSPWNSKIYNIRHVPEQPISKNRLS